MTANTATQTTLELDLDAVSLRDLPWRRTRDPWAILVSEFMAQQTQVARVVPKWEAFLDRFPTPKECADEALAETIRLWSGLGYNRRARYLHTAATQVRDRFDSQVPDALADLLSLSGVGPYTARAVLCFAFEEPVGVVDTNIGRVLARAAVGRKLTPKAAQELADDLVDRDDPWRWNQSLMEIGAMWCRPTPDCDTCPLRQTCLWRRSDNSTDPAVGSAAVTTRQSRFEGSDRQGRGRLVEALRSAPVREQQLSQIMGWPHDPDRARRVASSLIDDGLIEFARARYRLTT